MIEWKDLSFFVPVKKPANWKGEKNVEDVKEALTDEMFKDEVDTECTASGLPKEQFIRKNNKFYKQILFGSNGYVKPREMVAILGPSGSGKTSLLNALSQRLGLSAGSFMKGDISINGRGLKKGDYGKVGAFVQQDDVLQGAYSVREQLEFAAKIRTNLSDEVVNERVESVLFRLGLTHC